MRWPDVDTGREILSVCNIPIVYGTEILPSLIKLIVVVIIKGLNIALAFTLTVLVLQGILQFTACITDTN